MSFIITGTDTDVGKTVVAAGLVAALGMRYWKPVQSGLDPHGDAERVMELAGVDRSRIVPEVYKFPVPASPHLSARLAGEVIDPSRLCLTSDKARGVVIEGAGGVMVPLNEQLLFIDIFKDWNLPAILCARNSLGTINHTLLTIDKLKRYNISVAGVIYSGSPENTENQRIIEHFSGEKSLGILPLISPINAGTLFQAMHDHIDLALIKASASCI
jgi:dethiobiotin synthetase